MSNLIQHARRELEILGAEEDDIQHMLKVVQAFADVGMSGSQAAWHISLLPELLQFKNLAPLTDDPDEWQDRSAECGYALWQSRRNAAAFSIDGGRTYYLLSEGATANNPNPRHVSAMKKHEG